MIKEIILQNFRSLLYSNFKAGNVNLITGSRGSGKTSYLDALALVCSTDSEFHALLKYSYHEPGHKLTFKQLIEMNFFSHQGPQLESFSVRANVTGNRCRLFEIWKSDLSQVRILDDAALRLSPFIFVFESAEPSKILKRAIPFFKIAQVHRFLKSEVWKWPSYYLASDRVLSVELLTARFKNIRRHIVFQKALDRFYQHFDDIESFDLVEKKKGSILLVKTKDRQQPVPVHGWSSSILRALTILVYLYSNKKPYFLLDDVERHLSEDDLVWLVDELYRASFGNGTQIFATTASTRVRQLFDQASRRYCHEVEILNLNEVHKVSDLSRKETV